MTEDEFVASACRGSVPSVRDDGSRVLAWDVLSRLRPTCNDWTLNTLKSDHQWFQPDVVSLVEQCVNDGTLCYEVDEPYYPDTAPNLMTAEYFWPDQRWRHEAIREARILTKRFKHFVLGLLRAYPQHDIHAYALRNWSEPYASAMIAWEKAYDWLRERNLEERFKWE
jgi:hypothetical protein